MDQFALLMFTGFAAFSCLDPDWEGDQNGAMQQVALMATGLMLIGFYIIYRN